MHKKLMLACMAIAAFAAFVIAPSAQASPVLTSNGVAVPAGTSITAKNTGETLFTGPFNVKCTTAHLAGTVTANTGTSLKGEIPVGSAKFSGTGTGGSCTSALGNASVIVTSKLCLENIAKTHEFSITGCGGLVTFDLVVGATTCKYDATTIRGTYTTNVTPATVVLEAQGATEEEPRSFFCPDEGSLDMDFDLYTTDGTGLTIS